MNALTFRILSPRELDTHRGTCPLEIGRFTVQDEVRKELRGPLEISRIFSDNEIGDSILIAPMEGINGTYEVPVVEGSDGVLYMFRDSIYYSITKILGNN